jgi:hypothetical protein
MKRSIFMHLLTGLALAAALGGLATASPAARAQGQTAAGPADFDAVIGAAFTYQGRLAQSGVPVTGICGFQFTLWDAPAEAVKSAEQTTWAW